LPREAHITRQIEWKNTLSKYGCSVSLERTVHIRGAQVIVDVYAEAEEKTFLIEIGDIDDKRKTALMRFYAEQNPNIEFVHEPYYSDKMNEVLESLNAYRNSGEYKVFKRREHLKQLKEKKHEKRDSTIKLVSLFLGVFCFIFLFLSLSCAYWLYYITAVPVGIIMIVCAFIVLKPFFDFFSGNITVTNMEVRDEELDLDHECPQCGQTCSKEEYESGYCLDCDQIEMNLFEES